MKIIPINSKSNKTWNIKQKVKSLFNQIVDWLRIPAMIMIVVLILMFVQSLILTVTTLNKPSLIDEIKVYYGEKDVYVASTTPGVSGLDIMSHHMARSLYKTEGGMYSISLCSNGDCTSNISLMTDVQLEKITTRIGSLAVGDELPDFLIK